jgi:hypothetical protein
VRLLQRGPSTVQTPVTLCLLLLPGFLPFPGRVKDSYSLLNTSRRVVGSLLPWTDYSTILLCLLCAVPQTAGDSLPLYASVHCWTYRHAICVCCGVSSILPLAVSPWDLAGSLC